MVYKSLIYLVVSTCIYYNNKPVYVSTHAIIRARQRRITFPEHVEWVVRTGKMQRFGKCKIKFKKKTKRGSIICVGHESPNKILITTVEWGN